MEDVKQMIDGAIKEHETRLHKRSRVIANKPASIKELDDYCIEKGIDVLPQYIWDFFESKGWKVGKVPMKNWRAAVSRARYWEGAPRRKLPASAESIEKQKENIRQQYRGYLCGKTLAALRDLRKDGAFRKCHFFIDEILAGKAKR